MDEEWRNVPGYEGICMASSLGQVRRMNGSIANQYRQNGYRTVHLGRIGNKSSVREYVHRLVARAFLGNPPEGEQQVNHINGNRADNRPCNLEWCNASHNVSHAKRIKALGLMGDGPANSEHGADLTTIRKRARPDGYGVPTTVRLFADDFENVSRIQAAHPELNGLAETVRWALEQGARQVDG